MKAIFMPINQGKTSEYEEIPRLTPLHLAMNVKDLMSTRSFYGKLLGASEGRSTITWVDFNLFGHHLSFHLGSVVQSDNTGCVGDHIVPMSHFGFVLPLARWQDLANRLDQAGAVFVIPPSVRLKGEPGEQWVMFLTDPSGNPIEIKGFVDLEEIFSTN